MHVSKHMLPKRGMRRDGIGAPQHRRVSLKKTLLTLCLLGGLSVHAAAAQPNVIVIMADDLGYADVGFQGCKDIATPNIDKLAAAGARFTRGYVTGNMCGPCRAGFLTGRIQSTFGFYVNCNQVLNPQQGLPAKIKTIGHFMQDQGYVTGGVGKWHMGTADHQHPNEMGFSDWYGLARPRLRYHAS